MQLSQRCEIDNSKPQTSNIKVAPSLSKVVNLSSLKSELGGKHLGKSKVSRNAKSGIQISHTGNVLVD